MYLSPFLEHAGSEYARLARAEGVRALDEASRGVQAEAFRYAVRERHPGVQVARYDIREFVY